jgi:hypothetical protein
MIFKFGSINDLKREKVSKLKNIIWATNQKLELYPTIKTK